MRYKTEAQTINYLSHQVKQHGYIRVAEALNVALQYHEQLGQVHERDTMLRAWNWVLRQQ